MNKGFGLIEIVVGVSIVSICLFGLAAISELSLKSMGEALKSTKASFLLEEGMEAVKILRDAGWSQNLAVITPGEKKYLNFNGAGWQLNSSNLYIDDIFERSFVLENVYRDSNDDITLSGTLDPDIRKITVSVAWYGRKGTTTKEITGYIANLFNN